jgi:hypothetical protein
MLDLSVSDNNGVKPFVFRFALTRQHDYPSAANCASMHGYYQLHLKQLVRFLKC